MRFIWLQDAGRRVMCKDREKSNENCKGIGKEIMRVRVIINSSKINLAALLL